jgi:hypothetical protein
VNELTNRPFYLCELPGLGLCWQSWATDLNNMSLWHPLHEDCGFDVMASFSAGLTPQRVMLHEIRSGRYPYHRFVADVRRRQRVQVDAHEM